MNRRKNSYRRGRRFPPVPSNRRAVTAAGLVAAAAAAAFLVSSSSSCVAAFVVASSPSSGAAAAAFSSSSSSPPTTATALRVTYNDMEDLQKARDEFEAMMSDGTSTLTPSDDSHRIDDVTIMTSAGRARRELEMELLESLADSDGAVDELMHLWMYEHSPEEAARLREMESSCSDGLVEEEAALREMVERNPRWAEPKVRLAALLFFKGQTDNSYRAALEALQLKPFHFELSPLLVMLSLRQQDMGQALFWARQGLPSLRPNTSNRRRKEWVERSLGQAQEQWKQAEAATEAFLASMNNIRGAAGNGGAEQQQQPRNRQKEEEIWQ